MCVCVSRSSHIIIYMFTAFITTLQYNHIVTVWLVLSLLLDAYVNLLWCASVLVSWILSKGWIFPLLQFLHSNLYKSAIKCLTKTSSHNIRTYIHLYTHAPLYTYNIVQTLNMKHIFVEMQQHKKERGTRKTKTLHIDLVIMKKYSRMKYLFSEAEILDLFQCVSKMHTY